MSQHPVSLRGWSPVGALPTLPRTLGMCAHCLDVISHNVQPLINHVVPLGGTEVTPCLGKVGQRRAC